MGTKEVTNMSDPTASVALIALSRMDTLRRQHEVTTGNIARMGIPGEKAEHLSFREYIARDANGVPISMVVTAALMRDMTDGALSSTGNALDVALQGDGFFQIETSEGKGFTRNGQFSLNKERYLSTPDGDPVLSKDSSKIHISETAKTIQINTNGDVKVDGALAGTIGVFKLNSYGTDVQRQKSYFTTAQEPTLSVGHKVYQGTLEASNANGIDQIVSLIDTVREYEYQAKLIEKDYEMRLRELNMNPTHVA